MPLKPWGEYDDTIRRTMTEHGYIEITAEVERDIARRYCRNVEIIESLEEQIELQQRKKEKLVEAQDFSAAAKARDIEHDIRDRLDAIVKKAATIV